MRVRCFPAKLTLQSPHAQDVNVATQRGCNLSSWRSTFNFTADRLGHSSSKTKTKTLTVDDLCQSLTCTFPNWTCHMESRLWTPPIAMVSIFGWAKLIVGSGQRSMQTPDEGRRAGMPLQVCQPGLPQDRFKCPYGILKNEWGKDLGCVKKNFSETSVIYFFSC